MVAMPDLGALDAMKAVKAAGLDSHAALKASLTPFDEILQAEKAMRDAMDP